MLFLVARRLNIVREENIRLKLAPMLIREHDVLVAAHAQQIVITRF